MSDLQQPHLIADEIELWALGLLPAARTLHLTQCAACLTTAGRERKFFRELALLERFAPSAEFVERVMAQVQVPATKTV